MPDSDEILSSEAQYIFERAYGFEPKDGNLRVWKGYVPIRVRSGGETAAEVELVVPTDFPNVPPTVYIHAPLQHPNVENGLLAMRMLSRWRSTYHVFQVIVEIKRLFQKVPAQMIQTATVKHVDTQTQLAPLISQKNQLASILEQKRKELEEISTKQASSMSNQVLEQEKSKLLDEEILTVENQLFAIERQFEDADIVALDFTKKYFSLKKRLYLLESQAASE